MKIKDILYRTFNTHSNVEKQFYEDNREKLAEEVVDSWDMDCLLEYARTSLVVQYRDEDEDFQRDWKNILCGAHRRERAICKCGRFEVEWHQTPWTSPGPLMPLNLIRGGFK